VGEITRNEEVFEPIENLTQQQLKDKEIIEKDGKKVIKKVIQKK
jgi:hypothetical protein